MRRLNRKAFTALEMIIVVIIIGVLAAAGLNKYKNFTVTARKNTCLSNQEQITAAIRLVENDLGPLASGVVMRMHYDGTLDIARCATAPAQSVSNFAVWLGQVPPSWGVTNGANPNTSVLSKAQDMRLFRCPEDSNTLGPTYTGISTFAGVASGDANIYTFAKLYSDTQYARAAFSPAIPSSTTDPLEGFNWLRNSIEWQNTAFTFCRRWGLRDNTTYTPAPAAPLATVAGDYQYIPGGQELRLAHCQYAPQN